MPTNVRDPRSIITPDAFDVSSELLGLPLAKPGRRLGAMLVDLALIGTLTALLSGVQVMLWGTVALVLLYAALKPAAQQRTAAHGAMLLRISMGCLGSAILAVVLLVALATLTRKDGEEPVRLTVGDRALPVRVAQLLRSGGGLARAANALGDAEDPDEAELAATEFLRALPEMGLSREEQLDMLADLTPEEAPWRDSAAEVYRRAVDRVARDTAGAAEAVAGEGLAPAEPAAGERPVESLNLEEALREYASLAASASGGGGSLESERARALRLRLLPALGGDTLRALEETLGDEREQRQDLEEEVQRLGEEGSGFVALLRDVWDQLGSAVGLWSLYFTVALTLGKGQTVGKRLFGIRVLRLDGEPMSWWTSFERVGGYAAGIATGLLGFAQVLWDANRQCVHDKIVGTVVVMAGASPVPGSWLEARVAQPDHTPTSSPRREL